MKTVHFVTTNPGKVHTMHRALAPWGIEVVHVQHDLPEMRSDNPQKIAEQKVRSAFEMLQKPVIAQDSGFYITALNGFPRAFVNFALETIGIEGILRLVEGKPRACEFRSSIAFLDSYLPEPVSFITSNPGTLADEPRGTISDKAWSGLYLVFIPKGHTQTLAEMSEEEYKAWSETIHKNSYAAQFGRWFSERK